MDVDAKDDSAKSAGLANPDSKDRVAVQVGVRPHIIPSSLSETSLPLLPHPTSQKLRTEVILNCVALAISLLFLGRLAFGWVAFGLVVASAINHRLREHDAQQRRDIHRIHRAANYRIREVMPHPPNWIRYSEKERVLFLTNMIKVRPTLNHPRCCSATTDSYMLQVLWPFMRASVEKSVKLSIET